MDLQILNLVQPFIMPFVVVILGVLAKNIATNHDNRISLNSRIIDKRVDVYETVGKELNEIYSFISRVGHWKNLTPDDVITKKRIVDQAMHISRPYWSNSAFKAYLTFMDKAFEMGVGHGKDAKIKSDVNKFRMLDHWDSKWEGRFSDVELNVEEFRLSFDVLMGEFSQEFGFYQGKI